MSNGVGSYLRHLQNPADNDPINDGARRSLDGLGASKPRATAEQVKEVFEAAQREDQAQRDRFETKKNADAFIAGHPEIIDSDVNAQLLLNQVNTMFGDVLHTVDHWEAAYDYLRTRSNFLKLDKTVLAAQQKQAAKQRFDSEKARTTAITFDPNDDYSSMSLEEIKARAIEAHQREFELAGQRGGNGF